MDALVCWTVADALLKYRAERLHAARVLRLLRSWPEVIRPRFAAMLRCWSPRRSRSSVGLRSGGCTGEYGLSGGSHRGETSDREGIAATATCLKATGEGEKERSQTPSRSGVGARQLRARPLHEGILPFSPLLLHLSTRDREATSLEERVHHAIARLRVVPDAQRRAARDRLRDAEDGVRSCAGARARATVRPVGGRRRAARGSVEALVHVLLGARRSADRHRPRSRPDHWLAGGHQRARRRQHRVGRFRPQRPVHRRRSRLGAAAGGGRARPDDAALLRDANAARARVVLSLRQHPHRRAGMEQRAVVDRFGAARSPAF